METSGGRKIFLGWLPWGLFAAYAMLLLGLRAYGEIEHNHQRRNAVQFLQWLKRIEHDHAHRDEVRRYFDRGERANEQDKFYYSPRSDDTWSVQVDYDSADRVQEILIDGRTADEMIGIYRPR